MVQGEPADGGATSGAGRHYPPRSARQTTLTHRGGPPQALGGPGQSPAAPQGCRRGFSGSHPGPSWAAPPLPGRSAGAAAAGRLLGNAAPQRRSLPAAPARCPRRHCGAAAPRGALRAPPRVWGPEPPAAQRGGVGAASPAQPDMGCDKRKGPFWCLNAECLR